MKVTTAVVDSPYIHTEQLRHFLLFDVSPLVTVLLAPLYFRYIYSGWFEVGLLVFFWLLTGLGITVGYHRLFTHRSFEATRPLQAFLAVSAGMAAQGGVTSWAAIHRYHHEQSDKPGDLHSPNLHGHEWFNRIRGLFHSHFWWMSRHSYPNVVRYVPDILRNPMLSRINRYYNYWIALGLIIPAALGALYHRDLRGVISGFLWGGVFRIFVVEQIIWGVNSVCHMFGTRPYDTRENSRNMGVLALITLGECWHNNHHRFVSSPNFGLHWYKLDPGYWFIRLMQLFGLAWDLRVPQAAQIANRDAEPLVQAR